MLNERRKAYIFSGYEVVKILKKMKSEKCTGLDGIQIEFLKKG